MAWLRGGSVGGERARNLNGYQPSRELHVGGGGRRIVAVPRTSGSTDGLFDTQIRDFSSGS